MIRVYDRMCCVLARAYIMQKHMARAAINSHVVGEKGFCGAWKMQNEMEKPALTGI
jgi:hypothetical protein